MQCKIDVMCSRSDVELNNAPTTVSTGKWIPCARYQSILRRGEARGYLKWVRLRGHERFAPNSAEFFTNLNSNLPDHLSAKPWPHVFVILHAIRIELIYIYENSFPFPFRHKFAMVVAIATSLASISFLLESKMLNRAQWMLYTLGGIILLYQWRWSCLPVFSPLK